MRRCRSQRSDGLALLVLLVGLAWPSLAVAETWHVPDDFASVHDALSHAARCDVVLVGPGTWQTSVTVPEGVRLVADGDPDEVILDGGEPDDEGAYVGQVVILTNGATVEGFTLRRANEAVSMTGLWSEVRGNIIEEVGVGVAAYGSEGWIVGNRIEGAWDRAIYSNGSQLWIDDNEIVGGELGIDIVDGAGRILRTQVRETSRGLSFRDSYIEVTLSTLEDNETGALLNRGEVVVQASTFVSNLVGVYLIDSPAYVLDNYFEDSGYAILSDFSSATIVANEIHTSDYVGISEGLGSESQVSNNLLVDNAVGIDLQLADSHVHNNDFFGGLKGLVISGGGARAINNLFEGVAEVAFEGIDVDDLLAGFNLFWSNTVDTAGAVTDGSELYIDPLYDDDYQPDQNSPVINFGNPSINYNDPDGSRSNVGRTGGPLRDDAYIVEPPSPVTVDDQPSYSMDEATEMVIFVEGIHMSNDDPVRFRWDVDPNDGFEFCDSFTSAITFAPEDDGLYTLQLRATDVLDNEVIQTVDVEVYNTPPSIDWRFLGAPLYEGGELVVWADAWDAASADTVTIWIDFEGDGVFEIENHDTDVDGPVVTTWPLEQSGDWMSTLEARDDDGGVTQVGEELYVENLPPFLVEEPPETIQLGLELGWVVATGDPSPLDVVTVSVEEAPGDMRISGETLRWTPTEEGVFTYTLVLRDQDGGRTDSRHSIEVLPLGSLACNCSVYEGGRSAAQRSWLWACLALLMAQGLTRRRAPGRLG